MSGAVYPDETRARVAELAAHGHNSKRIARELGIPYTTVYRWLHPSYAARKRAASRAVKQRRRLGGPTEAALAVLAAGVPVSYTYLHISLRISPGHASVLLNRLVRYGLAERVERGVYIAGPELAEGRADVSETMEANEWA